ncbi:MAG: ribonuclease HI [bacterium]|nr:ribonuclease HI [bacterium]
MPIRIFTDGSSRGNPGPGGWGTIISTEREVIELGGREDRTTNNRMELVAAINALEYVRGRKNVDTDGKIELFSDSKYVIMGITEWIVGWQTKGWKTAGRKAVLNRDLWEKLANAKAGLTVEWKYVAGHTGHYGNERCDEIATRFADREDVHLYSGAREKYPIKLF